MVAAVALPLGTVALLVLVGWIGFEAGFLRPLSLIGRRFADWNRLEESGSVEIPTLVVWQSS